MNKKHDNIYKITPRGLARRVALDLFSYNYKITGRIEKALKVNRVQFVYFHHVFQSEENAFRGLISEIAANHQYISYSEGVDRVLKGRFDRPYVAISFDDGIKNCIQASKIMDEYGVKGCFFVCPSIVSELDEVKLAAFSKKVGMPPLQYLDWDDVNDLLKRGHEVGGHTMTHINLAEASKDRIAEEVGGSYELLRRKCGNGITHFAWPFGRFFHFSAGAAKVVFDSGYGSCASAERGCHVLGAGDARKLCIRRDSTLALWPMRHIYYFMARNLERSGGASETWPCDWSV